MKREIVLIQNKDILAGTFLIAQGFNRKHEHILKLINKYKTRFESFTDLKSGKRRTKRGRPIEEYYLNEDQCLFLGTLMRNSDIILDFKEKLVKEFSKARRELAAAKSQHSDQKWIMSRDFGKEQRLEATDSIKEFVEYAKAQGSVNADRYYTIITRMANGLLFICGDKFKNIREVLTVKQLMIIANAEQIISKGLKDGMKANTFYKDIYKQIKQNVLTFAELNGQTKVIEEQLKLTDKEKND